MSNKGGKFWNPPPPPDERPLVPEFPVPPYVMIGDVECVLERIPIDNLVEWRKRHNLVRVRTANMGRLGPVTVHWPKPTKENEPCDG